MKRSCEPPGCWERSHMVGEWGAVEVNKQSTVEGGGSASGSRENKLLGVGYLWLKRRKKCWVEKGTECIRDSKCINFPCSQYDGMFRNSNDMPLVLWAYICRFVVWDQSQQSSTETLVKWQGLNFLSLILMETFMAEVYKHFNSFNFLELLKLFESSSSWLLLILVDILLTLPHRWGSSILLSYFGVFCTSPWFSWFLTQYWIDALLNDCFVDLLYL